MSDQSFLAHFVKGGAGIAANPAPSFRGDAQHRTRNLEIPGLVLSDHPGMTSSKYYGRIAMFVAGPGVRSGPASRANSHSSERVLRGSMISSTQNFSAERNGERSLLRRSSISCNFALGSSEASMSAR